MASPKPATSDTAKEPSPAAPTPSQNDDVNDPRSNSQEPEDSSASSQPDSREQGEISESDAPPLPNEPLPETVSDAPPLPSEPVPTAEDDGWDYRWDPNIQNYIFFNRFTGQEQLENPRVPVAADAPAPAVPDVAAATAAAPPPPAITGYNPAVHGDYDPNAWYAKGYEDPEAAALAPDPDAIYESTALFNRFTGQYQTSDQGPGRHTDEAKAKRQMNAYFDVDAAANAHDGRSLKAERSGKKPTKAELKFFKEKRKARKEEKRRAWLRD
ncbi:hypothetical protein jhhlp_001953 [Lomentospora prolificans]|uniref:WW domain-containing protein n=1 Tax=Lomentospora prolificans TaxID=41688 RepID=A0A2N3NCR1_9PEZI|nr:hypothetical protein jhhlp_001953 [Lomentospora prolificans]